TGATSTNSTPLTPPSSSSTSSSISSSDCGISKTCVSQPTGCDPSTSSDCFFMAATPLSSGSGFMFELSGRADGYVALGFSDDTQMGNDDVYICGKDQKGVIQLQHAFTTGTTTPSITAL
ncbi:putative ferric-chelate reductase 1, partial [Clarias magur]